MTESNSEDHRADEIYEKANLKGDRWNFVLLTFLYLLQGSIMGIAMAIPSIVQKRGVTYENQVKKYTRILRRKGTRT